MGKHKRPQRKAALSHTSAPAPAPGQVTLSHARRFLPYLGIVTLVASVYGRTLSFGYVWVDDDRLIIERAAALRDETLQQIFRSSYFPGNEPGQFYYRPLVTLSYRTDVEGPQAPPQPYHRTNVLLHAVAACLFLALLRRLAFPELLATLLAAAFAVHPALTEVVAWIPGRNDSLLAVFAISSWLAFMHYREERRRVSLVLHLALFLLALLSKESAVLLPVLLTGTAMVLEKRRPSARSDRWLWIGWAAAIFVWLALRRSIPVQPLHEPLSSRLGISVEHLPAFLLHLGKILLPWDLSVLAHVKDARWWPGMIAGAAVVAVAVHLRIHRQRPAPLVIGTLTFLLFLAPTLPVSDFLILENRLYLPAMGILIAVGALVREVDFRRPAALAPALIALGLMTVATVRYSNDFRDRTAFAEAAIRRSPNLALAQMVAGNSYKIHNELDRAEAAYRRCLELDPTRRVAHNNLAVVYLNRRQFDLAERELQAELRIDPTYDSAYYNLGLVYRELGRLPEAASAWQQAEKLNPNNIDALGELMVYHQHIGDMAGATRYRRKLEARGVRFLN